MSTPHGAESTGRAPLRCIMAGVALVFTVLLTVIAFPPFDVAEAAYVLAVPLLLWTTARPRWRRFLLGAWGAYAVSWFFLLIWLRHMEPPMGWIALIVLSGILGAFNLTWAAAARWLFPRAMERSLRPRLIALLGLAGAWVVIEWARSWMLFGFPWATLAVSQWQRPPMLQIAAWTGAYGVSFILIFFNLALAGYFWRLLNPEPDDEAEGEEMDAENDTTAGKNIARDSAPDQDDSSSDGRDTDPDAEDERGRPYRSLGRSLLHTRPQRPVTNALSLSGAFSMARAPGGSFTRFLRVSPELALALAMVLGSLWLFFKTIPRADETGPMFKAGVVQPWTDPQKKWDINFFRENLLTLSSLTERAALSDPDLIVWPEAATPGPLLDPEDPRMKAWVEQLVNFAGVPLLTGNMAIDDGHWYNAAFVIYPASGTYGEWYAKQKRVPFGEFVPFREWLPFLGKFVPLEDIARGPGPVILPVELPEGTYNAGPLICYEDIFPTLARQVTAMGADFLLVVTNDAWYGQEGGAIQHAAHSVLRAVETRRPVLRCGNNGWSGWIDEQGRIRDVLRGINGSTYFQGTGTFDLRHDLRWGGVLTPYVRYGDWFVGLCALFFAWAAVRENRLRV
ncbi:apolipoprotein N-acyltransferase [Ruficoccus amylovorans]|uniref:Apolipoprotein N-acyltransferase n=1 Tax=Ruficoccus amylovorans TaxID=1804625 RepID=A0A842HA07_9BACT|nr:apolipoprotein N-acyltransferase [Ruficoccus amylovorans]MBC2593140.1 apolipoprotein N-acyltransferase [Ruficoccus amylovorans]